MQPPCAAENLNEFYLLERLAAAHHLAVVAVDALGGELPEVLHPLHHPVARGRHEYWPYGEPSPLGAAAAEGEYPLEAGVLHNAERVVERPVLGVLRYARGVHQQRAARLVEVLGLVLCAGLILQHEDVVAHLRHVLGESWSPRAQLARGTQCVILLLYPAPRGVVRYVARREQVVDQQVGLSLFGHGELWFGTAGYAVSRPAKVVFSS